MAQPISAVWRQIESLLNELPRNNKIMLRDVATNADLRAAEQQFGTPLPDDWRDSLQIHDGQAPYCESLLEQWRLLPVSEAVYAWSKLNKLNAIGVFKQKRARSANPAAEWWSNRWIPFTENGAGDYLMIDMSSATSGSRRILHYSHESGERPVVATDLSAWLNIVVRHLEELKLASSVAAAAAPKSSSPPSMAELMSLLGRKLDDPEVRRFLATQPLVKSEDADVLECDTFGYDISYAKKAIEQLDVHLHRGLKPSLSPG